MTKQYVVTQDAINEIGLQLAPRISKMLDKHRKSIYGDSIRAKSDMGEVILSKAISQAKMGPSGHEPGSHRVEHDMWLSIKEEGIRNKIDLSVSHKSGKYFIDKNEIEFTGYRTTGKQFVDLDSRIKHFHKASADLFIFLSAKNKASISDPYYFTIISAPMLRYGAAEDWQDMGNGNYRFESDSLSAKIAAQCSQQLTTRLRLDQNAFIVEV